MAYFRKVEFKNDAGTILETIEVDSIQEFFRQFVFAVENFVSNSTAVKDFDYYGASEIENLTAPIIRVGFGSGSFSGALFEIISDPLFVWTDSFPDPLEIVRQASGAEKMDYFIRLWKEPAWRDVHRILHKGK